MSISIALFIVGAAFFVGLVFAAVNVVGTRLTGQQIHEDPDVRNHVDPKQRDEDFPVTADF